MIYSTWPSGVNTKFFSYSSSPKENTETSEFISGRTVSWQKNTKKTNNIECKIMLSVGTELNTFWTWFNDTLGQTAIPFTCSALGSSYYRFTALPNEDDTDQAYKTLTLSIEEY